MKRSRESQNTVQKINEMMKMEESDIKPSSVSQRVALGDIRNIIPRTIRTYLQVNPIGKENGFQNLNSVIPPKPKSKKRHECEEKNVEISMASSSQESTVEDIDSADHDHPHLVSVYVNDIYKHLWELENNHRVQSNFLEGQKITKEMRAVLIDWLVQVQLGFSLSQETLYLTVAIIDRYLMAVETTIPENLQLVGSTALLIASKYEEIFVPQYSAIVYIADETFSTKDICNLEVQMLQSLKWYISYPLPLNFLRRNCKAGHVDAAHHTLAKYLMELTLLDSEFSHCKPSKLAAAALYLSMQIISNGTTWNATLTHYSKYTTVDIMPVVRKLAALAMEVPKSKLQAVYRKYKAPNLMRISEIKDLKPPFSNVIKQFAGKASSKLKDA